MRRPIVHLLLGSALFAAIPDRPAQADILGFGDFSNFTINHPDSGSAPSPVSGGIELTTNSVDEFRSIFYDTPQSVSQFTASFTYQAIDGNAGNASQGATFVLLNATTYGSSGPSTVGGGGGEGTDIYGYSGMSHSVGVSLELNTATATGMFTNGAVGGGSTPTAPVNLLSGDPINVTLTYNGTELQATLTDATTSQSYSATYLVNLPGSLGSTVYVGFGAMSGENTYDQQNFTNFQYTTSVVPEPASAALGWTAVGIAATFALARRRFTRPSRVRP